RRRHAGIVRDGVCGLSQNPAPRRRIRFKVLRSGRGARANSSNRGFSMGDASGRSRLYGALAGGLLATAALPAAAHDAERVLTHEDYARAERFMGYNTTPLVDHVVTAVVWQDDGHFWFRDHDADGDHFRRVEAATGTVSDAFDRERLATALADATGEPVDAAKLGVTGIATDAEGRLEITIGESRYRCALAARGGCGALEDAATRKPGRGEADAAGREPAVESPD